MRSQVLTCWIMRSVRLKCFRQISLQTIWLLVLITLSFKQKMKGILQELSNPILPCEVGLKQETKMIWNQNFLTPILQNCTWVSYYRNPISLFCFLSPDDPHDQVFRFQFSPPLFSGWSTVYECYFALTGLFVHRWYATYVLTVAPLERGWGEVSQAAKGFQVFSRTKMKKNCYYRII